MMISTRNRAVIKTASGKSVFAREEKRKNQYATISATNFLLLFPHSELAKAAGTEHS